MTIKLSKKIQKTNKGFHIWLSKKWDWLKLGVEIPSRPECEFCQTRVSGIYGCNHNSIKLLLDKDNIRWEAYEQQEKRVESLTNCFNFTRKLTMEELKRIKDSSEFAYWGFIQVEDYLSKR